MYLEVRKYQGEPAGGEAEKKDNFLRPVMENNGCITIIILMVIIIANI